MRVRATTLLNKLLGIKQTRVVGLFFDDDGLVVDVRRQPNVARRMLDDWIGWAAHSKLAPFAKLARTIRAHIEGIIAYVATGLSNGHTEGLNGKARTITRRSYGLHTPRASSG